MRPFEHWPQLESLVQDGRYSYAGAAGAGAGGPRRVQGPAPDGGMGDRRSRRGAWARAGHRARQSPAVTPPINLTVTILNVDLTFPLRTLPPRRACTGGIVKPSTFMDLVVTTSD